MRAALYVRIACWTQDQKSARELKSQLEALRNYASQNGMEIVEEFTDAGYSGLRRDRPGLNRMREVAGRRGFDVLLTRDPGRLARDSGLQVSLLEELEQLGVRSIFLEGRPCRRSTFDVQASDGSGQEELFTVEGWSGGQERGTSCPAVAPPERG
jgi:DNA invertase Pin-like site-specific DNA recombinase